MSINRKMAKFGASQWNVTHTLTYLRKLLMTWGNFDVR